LKLEAVILYGSWYIGTAKPEADVDLALVMAREGFSRQQRGY
jgi:predicted nucleotidyltransferase